MGLDNFERTQIQNLVSFIADDSSVYELDSSSIDERYHQYKKELIQNYKDFAKNIKNVNWEEFSDYDKDNILSHFDFDLTNTIDKLNKLNFEMGMKSGARVVHELLVKGEAPKKF